MKLNEALYGAKRSAIREFSELAGRTPGCVALTLGEPDFATPQPICSAVTDPPDRPTILTTTAHVPCAKRLLALSKKKTAWTIRPMRSF